MKVCIVAHVEKTYLPYMNRYINFLKNNNIECDIICWQREESSTIEQDNEYNYFEPASTNAFGKLLAYHRYRKFVIDVIKKNKYDKVVVLTTVMAISISSFLLKEYKNRYLFDIRDYTFEKFKPYKGLVDKLIKNSALTTISSKGFMDFLNPSEKIAINHNMSFTETVTEPVDIKTKQVINIGFVGCVRYYEENIELINQLKNTFKYQLWYIGQPMRNCDLEGYCAQNEITNVSFVGKYNNDQKPELYKSIDVVNSIYGDDSLEVTTALPNRLYEACLFKKPIISSKKTFLGEVIDQYRLGMVVDIEHENILEILDEYIKNFDQAEFLQGCQMFIEDVKRDEEILSTRLYEFII